MRSSYTDVQWQLITMNCHHFSRKSW